MEFAGGSGRIMPGRGELSMAVVGTVGMFLFMENMQVRT